MVISVLMYKVTLHSFCCPPNNIKICLKNIQRTLAIVLHAESTEKISRISVAISLTSLILVTFLFMRIEFVYNNSKALEIRLENRIQRIDDDLKTNIERIAKKRLQIYETASTTRRKERPDVIFGKSLFTRTSVVLALNNQHYTASQHRMIYR